MISLFPSERLVFIREHSMGSYSTLTYYFSKIVSEAPFTAFFTTFFSVIVYFMVTELSLRWLCFIPAGRIPLLTILFNMADRLPDASG